MGSWRHALAAGDTRQRREVLGALIERVKPERLGYGRFRVLIAWADAGERLRHPADTAAEREVA